MKVLGILIDVSGERGRVCELEIEEGDDSLEPFYKALNCSTIDITQRSIGGRVFDIVCDDEGLLVENPRPSAVRQDGKIMLVGNLFICNHYKEHLASLSKEDCKFILQNVGVVSYKIPDKKMFTSPILMNVNYPRM